MAGTVLYMAAAQAEGSGTEGSGTEGSGAEGGGAEGSGAEGSCDNCTREKNVIRKSLCICATLARREMGGAVDLFINNEGTVATRTSNTLNSLISLCSRILLILAGPRLQQ